MRQVPQNLNSSSILLIGSGRLAQHLAHYFELEKILFKTWSRKAQKPAELQSLLAETEIILLAISDSAIAGFIEEHKAGLIKKKCVHFSGARVVLGAWSFHPLMSFSGEFYTREVYESMHFVIEEGAPKLNELLPQLKNQSSFLAKEKRALYHALCSMSGNFSVLLWEYAIRSFEKELGLKGEVLGPYLNQIFQNINQFAISPAESRKTVLTGPLARRDFETIERHLLALKPTPMKSVYEAFVNYYEKSQQENAL